jgi:hypothetical protein
MQIVQRRAARLSEKGWKFLRQEGPRGTYYEGFGPQGKRVMTEQKPTEQEALFAAIRHAFDVQFPLP